MQFFRVLATLQGWLFFALACVVVGGLAVPPTLGLERRWPGVRARFDAVLRRVLRTYVRSLVFLRLEVEREERRLTGPHVLVANHQSWLDPIVLMAIEPRVSGPARDYLFRFPFLRSIMRLVGFYPVESSGLSSLPAMQRGAAQAREEGRTLIFFPEGTRSRSGDVGEFQRGAFRIAHDHGLWIQPVVIDGLDRVLPPGSPMVKGGFRERVRVRYLEPVAPPGGDGPRREAVRGAAEQVRKTLVAELAEMRAASCPDRASGRGMMRT